MAAAEESVCLYERIWVKAAVLQNITHIVLCQKKHWKENSLASSCSDKNILSCIYSKNICSWTLSFGSSTP